MQAVTFTSRDFNHNPGRIKRAAKEGPVIITERDRPDLVVMSYSAYTSMAGLKGSFIERISMPGLSDVELDTRLPPSVPYAADFD